MLRHRVYNYRVGELTSVIIYSIQNNFQIQHTPNRNTNAVFHGTREALLKLVWINRKHKGPQQAKQSLAQLTRQVSLHHLGSSTHQWEQASQSHS